MELFIDSADRAAILPLLRTGLADGVTTNPEILQRAGLGSGDVPEFVAWAHEAGARRIFVQSWGTDTESLVTRGAWLRTLSDRVVVKVPATPIGYEAAAALRTDGDVLLTALHRASQIIPVIASGATYAAVFVGRAGRAGLDAVNEATQMQAVVDRTGASTVLMAGSLREPQEIADLAQVGLRCFTFGPAVWQSLLSDDLSLAASTVFEELSTRSA